MGLPAAPDLAAMRASLDGLGLGEVALQEFGSPSDILIRVEHQAGGEQGQITAVDKVKAALAEQFGQDVSYRRVEFVGPKVSEDLLWAGTQATVYALFAILLYIWFRFEWQFAVGAVVALDHCDRRRSDGKAMMKNYTARFTLPHLRVDGALPAITKRAMLIRGHQPADLVVKYH